MGIDWEQLEEKLYELTRSDIGYFSTAWPDDRVYGFAFDCNSEYGQVLLCANTKEDLQAHAEKYAKGKTPNAEAFRKISESLGLEPQLPSNDVEAEIESLLWSLGDWKYQGFQSQAFTDGWSPLESAVLTWCLESDEEEDPETFMTHTQVEFMRRVCHVMVRLEQDEAFDILNRTDDFKTWVTDHDEPEESAWDRLNEIRQEMLGANDQ